MLTLVVRYLFVSFQTLKEEMLERIAHRLQYKGKKYQTKWRSI